MGREGQVTERSVKAFLAMNAHVADCFHCRQGDRQFHVVMQTTQDGDELNRISHSYCIEQQRLALNMTEAAIRDFGEDPDIGLTLEAVQRDREALG